MKMILFYTDSDECSYSCDVVVPFEYESTKKAMTDFMQLAETTAFTGKYEFQFLSEHFMIRHFIEKKYDANKKPVYIPTPPDIYTLEEWFEKYQI